MLGPQQPTPVLERQGHRPLSGRELAARARSHIHTAYDSPLGCDTAMIADALQVSASHLCHQYRKAYGATIGNEVRQLRIARARNLLATTDMLMKEVAAACGYYSNTYRTFHGAFRSVMKMSPREYRRGVFEGRIQPDHSPDLQSRVS